MINKIFWDIDNTLVFTCPSEPEQNHIIFSLDSTGETHKTIIRPCAKRLVKFTQEVVGATNVYILTAAIQEYAQKINELGDLGVLKENIISRETIEQHYWHGAYGGGGTVPSTDLANKNNLLIDNLPPRYNEAKIALIGISSTWATNYLQVRDYYGVNYPDDKFENQVIEFVKRHED